MSTFLYDSALGVFANFVSIILIAIITYIVIIWLARRQRRSLFNLFGLSDKNPDVTIYVSRLQIMPKGTLAVGNEKITNGYIGPAINFVEYKAAETLRDLLRTKIYVQLPKRIDFFKLLRNDSQTKVRRLEPQIEISPLFSDRKKFSEKLSTENPVIREIMDKNGQNSERLWEGLGLQGIYVEAFDRSRTNMILIGNGIYNIYSQYYLTDSKFSTRVPFEFRKNPSGERALFVDRDVEIKARQYSENDRAKYELGVIQRLVDEGKVIFICAGLGSRATKASALWLADKWEALSVRAKSEPEFTVYLKVKSESGPDDGDINVKSHIRNIDDDVRDIIEHHRAGSATR